MSVEKARFRLILAIEAIHDKNPEHCKDAESHELLTVALTGVNALIAEVRSEQVAHVANCRCCLAAVFAKCAPITCVHCSADQPRHPTYDSRCKPLDLHDAEVRLEVLQESEGRSAYETAHALESAIKRARAAVDKLKGK